VAASVDDVIAYSFSPMNMPVDNGDPQQIFGGMVSGNLIRLEPARAVPYITVSVV
jgi:hypothetical protein